DISRFNEKNVNLNYKTELGLNKDAFLVGWLGSMSPFKGLKEIILPLIHQLSQETDDIHFVIAGYGLLEKEIKIWIEKNKTLPVTLLGRIPYDITPSFTISLDVYLVPTNPGSEFARSICPVKCFDAIAMGTDVITTKTRATKFLEDISEKVHLCDFNIDSFRDTITNLYKTRNMQKHKPDSSDIFPFTHQNVSIQIAEIIQKNM
ncbi:glycosyltransferase, partial [bacterium]|nr:glycosyltransferase [bacterium]